MKRKINIIILVLIVFILSCKKDDSYKNNPENKYKYDGAVISGNPADLMQIINRGKIENYLKSIKTDSISDIKDLTPLLIAKSVNDGEKTYAFFYWINRNIKYELPGNYKSIEKTLKERKGVCSDFSYLFAALCDESKIKPVYILGWINKSSDGSTIKQTYHAWNAFQSDGKWYLVDVSLSDFLPKPSDFVLSHEPQDSKWSLIN